MAIRDRDSKEHYALRGILLAALVILVLGCTQACIAYTQGDPEYRGFWVDAWHAGAWSQYDIDTMLGVPGDANSTGLIRDANCNTVVVQVRRNCDVNYPSAMNEPYMSGLTPGTFNALQAAINAAHDTTGGKKRIQVYANIVTFRTSGGKVYGDHTSTPTGSLTNLDNYWPSLSDSGAVVTDKAFDPGHPLVEEYTVNVAMDLVNHFDIDGIQYDYIRFTADNQGYNPTSIARYNARYGLTGKPAATDDQFKQWRRDQITAFVRKMYAKIQAVKPWINQSASVVTGSPAPTSSTRAGFQGTRPYYETYSDWDSWLQEGIIDAAFPMTYYDYGSNPGDYALWMNFEKDRHADRHMVIGPGLYLNSLSNAITELEQTRTPSPSENYADGFCGYSYFAPYTFGGTNYGAWADFSPSFIPTVTPTWADAPTMPWKTSPTKAHISGTVTYLADGKWADGALVSIVGPESRTQYCDGTGFYAFIGLPPGTYTLTVSQAGCSNIETSVTVALGEVTGDMYVNDFQLRYFPPVITNVTATNVSASGATITWTTNQGATSQVQYGTTEDYGTMTELNGSNVTSHSVNLTGLSPLTTYHYQVLSTNVNGSSSSTDFTFSTGELLVISNVQASGIGGGAATITWATSQASSSKVEYGVTSEYGSSTTTDNTAVFSHSVNLIGLSPNTTYHYRVVSANNNGTVPSDDYTFATADFAYISDVHANSITSTGATITWATDIGASSQVEYGLTTGYGSATTVDNNLVTAHSVPLTSLAPNTTYNYRVKSTSAAGTSTTANYTFRTSGPPTITNVQATNVTFYGATITWTTDNLSDSTVNYGSSASYGSVRTDANLVTSHSMAITGLIPSRTYHFRCASATPFGADTSADFTFTTASAVPDIIIDNDGPGWQNTSPNGNSWSSGSIATVGKVGTTYLYSRGEGSAVESSSTRKCTWTPTIMTDGTYDVYAYYQTGLNRSNAAPFKVYYQGASLTSLQNQYQNSNLTGWYLLGSNLPFKAGTAGYVEVSTLSTDATGLVSADGVKWVYKGPPDETPPAVTIGAPSVTATAAGPVDYTISYSGADAVTLAQADVTLLKTGTANGTVSVTGTGTSSRTVHISGITGDGTIGISIAAGTASDVAGNLAAAVGPSATFAADNTAPTISVGAPSASSTTVGPISYTITYGGASSISLSAANVTLNKTGTANATVGVSGTGATTRTVTLSSISGSGTLGISIAAATASDTAGNTAAAADPSTTFTVDNDPPTVSIGAPSVAATAAGPIDYAVSYSGADAVTLAQADVTLVKTGTANGTISVTGNGTSSRTVSISSITGDGTLAISLAAGTASDTAGNTAAAAGPSATFSVDNTAPTISVGAPSVTTTGDGPVNYSVSYNGADAVTLTQADVTLVKTGTANGTISVTGSGTSSRTVSISSITGDGTLGISIADGTASDAVGNTALASGASTTFAVDNTAPTVSIGAPSSASTNDGPVSYTVTYSGAGSISLSATDITLNKTGTANGTVSVTGTGTSSRTVSISSITGDGTLGISIAAGSASDAAGNTAVAAGPSTTFAIDNTAPTVSIGAPSVATTRAGPISYTISYSGASSVSLSAANVTLNKTGTANGTIAVTGAGTDTRTVSISSITGDGTLGVSIAAGTASDAAGNTAVAAGPSSAFVVDNTVPTISISAPSVASTRVGPVTYTITYGGASSISLTTAKITLVKTGTANGTMTVTGTGTTSRIVTISAVTGTGTLGIYITAGSAGDAAGNAAPVKSSTAFTVDNTPPTIAIGAPSVASTRAGPVTYTVTYDGASSVSLSTAKITLVKTGTANAALVTVSGTGTATRTVTLSSLTGSGTIAISIAAGTAADAVSNSAPASVSRTVIVDNTVPVMTTVTDEKYTASTTTLKASWVGSDPESGIVRYEYAVGTTALGTQIKTWTSAGTSLSATITGLPLAAGTSYYVSVRAVNGVSLVSTPLSSPGVRVAQAAASIQAAKLLPNGTVISLPTRVVSAVFPTAFYIEESGLTSGIRVELTTALVANQSVRVLGKVGVAANGERAILEPIVPDAPTAGVAIAPVAVANTAVGGATSGLTPGPTAGKGTNNTGLLVKITGKVTSVVADGFYLDDGSKLSDGTGNVGVKVWTGKASSATNGASLSVIGAVSLRKSGTTLYPQILRK